MEEVLSNANDAEYGFRGPGFVCCSPMTELGGTPDVLGRNSELVSWGIAGTTGRREARHTRLRNFCLSLPTELKKTYISSRL